MRRTTLLLTAAIGAAALLAFFYPSMKVNAADENMPVEGEDFARPVGSNEITGAGYSGGAALKFTQDNTASHPINCTATCNVVLMASGGQSGGQPTFRVNSEPAQDLRSTTVMPYTFVVNLPAGERTIEVTAGNTGTGRNAILDVATFPASGSGGGTDTTPPDTTITSGPSGSLTGTTARFTFDSNETGSTFSCRLLPLESSRTPCTSSPSSPKTYTNLTVGTAYTFKVWAKDTAGNIDASPAKSTFTPTGGSDTDTDDDGVPDSYGQLPDVANADQADSDGDDIGDACPRRTASAVLVGAGDISSGGNRDQDTGNLIRTQLNSGAWGVFTTGDNAYPDGTYNNYLVYDAAWGSFRNKTRPTYGNHDYYGSSTAVDSERVLEPRLGLRTDTGSGLKRP